MSKTAIEMLAPMHKELIEKAEALAKEAALVSKNTEISLSRAFFMFEFGSKDNVSESVADIRISLDDSSPLVLESTVEFSTEKIVHVYGIQSPVEKQVQSILGIEDTEPKSE